MKTQCAFLLFVPLLAVLILVPIRPLAAEGMKPLVDPSGSLTGYDVLASAGEGRTLFVLKAGVHSAKEGVLAALHDFRAAFDDKLVIGGAFGDIKDRQCQGAFMAKLKGQPAQGTVFCGVGDNGAAITVVYHRKDAPVQEVAKLMGALPTPVQWVEHKLPGGSGTLKLPSDWKILSSSALGSVSASGPSGQIIGLGIGAQVTSPNSFLAPQARASGMALVAPFSDPVTAVKNLSPQWSAMSQKQGGPAITLNRIITNSPATAQLPNGQAAWIYSAVTRGTGPQAVPVRELAIVECYPVSPIGWGILLSFGSAPDSSFDTDLPIMMQIAQAWKLNDQAISANSQAMINAQQQNFAAIQRSMDAKNAAFDSFRRSMRNSERVREQGNADFLEVIHGYRTVENTDTGYRQEVDLGNSKRIVDKLNERVGYQRYKEVPLRDQ